MATATQTSSATNHRQRAKEAAEHIVDAFQEPQRLPEALAPMFVHRKDDVPCRAWSWCNQLLVALNGHSDARGYRQWQKVGRHVKKGARSFIIFSPVLRTVVDEETEEEKRVIAGFKGTSVFGYSQTEGEPLPEGDREVEAWLEALPLLEVARSWDITVEAFDGRAERTAGRYRRGDSIALGVENLSTWCHELVHAADDRNGNLNEMGQHWRSETVAELGSAVLLRILGREGEADLGGCWEYIASYAEDAGIEPVTACTRVLNRTCDAVALIVETAESLSKPVPAE